MVWILNAIFDSLQACNVVTIIMKQVLVVQKSGCPEAFSKGCKECQKTPGEPLEPLDSAKNQPPPKPHPVSSCLLCVTAPLATLGSQDPSRTHQPLKALKQY